MKRRHRMPFGAEVLAAGRVRFRLWAPSSKRVDLCLEDREYGFPGGKPLHLPMATYGDGWFELATAEARAGSCYRFRIDGGPRVPDPASRYNPADVHGPSQVIDPCEFLWEDEGWRGRPWSEAVIYELHVGTFTPAGTFAGVKDRLDYLVDLGVTVIELMPVADFPGARNWGYDGVLPFAPDSSYGHPEDLKDLVQTAHQKGLMVFLDVVYNHFGPEGNYLHTYAPQFFSDRHHTPWGAAINFNGPGSHVVRDFFIHNALYWLTEYHLDGLRLDAVHAILDDSDPDILLELAQAVQQGLGKERHVHLVLENDHNAAHYLKRGYRAQWNDDIHHALHVLLTGETDGYYQDYADRPVGYLGRCLTEGFAYQGEPSSYRGGVPRGELSRDLAPTAFVALLQNHDQVGNRAFGERLVTLVEPRALRAAIAIVLLAPSPPLLFMGEEWGMIQPFLFFCDFGPDLAVAVTEGRRNEFARFDKFADPAVRATIPDPNAVETFERTRLDWNCLTHPPHDTWLQLYRDLLALRRRAIVPRLQGMQGGQARFHLLGERGLAVDWQLGDGSVLSLLANLGPDAIPGTAQPRGEILYTTDDQLAAALEQRVLLPWSAIWFLDIGCDPP